MAYEIKRGPLANTSAFHDFKHNLIDFKGWFYCIEEWFRQENIKPTKIDYTGKNGVKGRSTIKFENGKKQLESCNFEGIDGIWVSATLPHVGIEMIDFMFAAHLDCSSTRGTFMLCWDDQVTKFERGYLENLAKSSYLYLQPAYGYSYQREFQYNPSFYPFGMTGGNSISREEEVQITKWQVEYSGNGNYKTGMLRDIYPINFLSANHMRIEIEGQKLLDWIQSNSSHGDLEQLLPDLWSWWIPKEDIEIVKQPFISSGLLIAYR